MEELIKRMEQDGKNAAVITIWYSEFLSAVDFCKNLHNSFCLYIDTDEYTRFNKLYEDMNGFIWGLYTVGYISDKTRNSIISELIYATRF